VLQDRPAPELTGIKEAAVFFSNSQYKEQLDRLVEQGVFAKNDNHYPCLKGSFYRPSKAWSFQENGVESRYPIRSTKERKELTIGLLPQLN
jgi:hypothetical protein